MSSLSSLSEPLTRTAEHGFSGWVHSPVFEQIRTTDENGWTYIQTVSLPSSFWADRNCWQEMHSKWAPSPVFEQIRTTDKVEHPSSMWVWSLVFDQIRTTDENGWTCILLRWTKTERRSGKIPKPWSRRLTMSGIVMDVASAYVLCPRSQSRWVR